MVGPRLAGYGAAMCQFCPTASQRQQGLAPSAANDGWC